MSLVKVDSKGRVSLPREFREMVGDTVEITPVGREKVLLSRASKSSAKVRRKRSEARDFSQLLDKEPRRTGKPENPSPGEMKSIWSE
ncbi:MAG TPA: AbrB/MazE/SpoVT family DNA-binding domain-containing protein [Nitrososphaerales archaeon]|nr:AbrB/MazE/SpoVT family DNA-binding domain-containing protein [Nitrososphaerales archaeon]